MCNCGKRKPAPMPKPTPSGVTPSSLTLNGRTTQFGSGLEARAANVRAGGAGIVRPVIR